ncbi:hypothetical protein FSP39_014678 [Pinctada imbricata]|uniref:non-specific serine/threonine protein kinase n=1 Tax=Pinctada imbricata TaxID=66713 RepID=A0AA89BZZ5_PINIB|nr:hypothetical protein FSP39_014678 [Pinctada imbricata]
MNGLHNHYHNSVSGLVSDAKYKPNTAIRTEQLTQKYCIEKDIGRGKFAVVKKCVNKESGEEVAAKFIRKRRKGKTCRDEILREVVMLEMALEHPRLVDLKEVYESQSELILVTEYCSGGELFTECVIEESFKDKETEAVRLMRQILEGLVYLHERQIVHLDLKPQNILLTKPFPEGNIKICDLGFACLVNTGEDIRDIIGTPDYVAPEVLSYEPLGLYTDMWSLGVLTYVMLTAHSPFVGADNQETFLNISQVNLDFPECLFQDVSAAAQDFIGKLLIKDPEDRLTAHQCLDHPWISGVVNPEKLLEDINDENISDDNKTKNVTSVCVIDTGSGNHSNNDGGSNNMDMVEKAEGENDEMKVEYENDIIIKKKGEHIECFSEKEQFILQNKSDLSENVQNVYISTKTHSSTNIDFDVTPSKIPRCNDENMVEDFKEKFKKEGDHLVNDIFPAKILELEDIYQSTSLAKVAEINTDLNIPVPDPILFNNGQEEPKGKKRKLDSENHMEGESEIPGTKVMILPNGPAPCNKKLVTLAERIKPLIRELIDHANMLKMWIAFLIPKIEDGNNFGVSVQEDTMGEARQVESEAASYLDQVSRYFITRAKLVSKVAKYPHIEDYRQSVRELDEKEYVSLRLICCELRNHYASLHDMVMKNIDKIKKPRSANAESLY